MNSTVQFAIRLGNQTAFAAGRTLEPFEFAVANGFAAFEFFPDRGFSCSGGWDERELNGEARRWIRETAAAKNILLSVHAPLEFNPLRNPGDERLFSTMQFASDIGARLVNLHLEAGEGAEKFLDSLRPALEAAADADLLLVLENTVLTGPADFNRFFALLNGRAANFADRAGMCFDLGHANLCAATHNDYLRFVDSLSPLVPVRHLHLHENFGDRDSHLVLFTGPSRFDPAGLQGLIDRLRRKNFHGCGIFEQWPQPPDALVRARDGLLHLIGNQT